MTDPGLDTLEDATIIILSDVGDVKDKDFNGVIIYYNFAQGVSPFNGYE